MDLGHVQRLGGPDGHRARGRLDVQHIARPAVGGGRAHAQPSPLADGEAVGAVVAAHHGAAGVHDAAGRLTQRGGQEGTRVTVGDEADVVAVGLGGHGQAARRRLRPHLRLGGVTQREQRPAQLLTGEHGEHVGLVLGRVRAAVQAAVRQPRVVPGADRVEAEGHRPVQHRRELDLLVAPQARVGRAPLCVLGHEIGHHVLVEPLRHVPHVERDPDHVRGAPGVPGVLQRAAAPRPGPVRLRVQRQREMDAGHLVTGVRRPRRGHRGVHPARHGRQHPHPAHSPSTVWPPSSPGTTPRVPLRRRGRRPTPTGLGRSLSRRGPPPDPQSR